MIPAEQAAAGVPVVQVPYLVCHDMQAVKAGGETYFLEIRVTAELAGDGRASWPRKVPAGLGRKIAGLVREQCGGGVR